ncbi:hypothetical protein B0H11DRAFT_1984038 [Mycena galericulata]|nr:hypothetical protein B0H11DRAFT_1984038 [Mycena galericulata]
MTMIVFIFFATVLLISQRLGQKFGLEAIAGLSFSDMKKQATEKAEVKKNEAEAAAFSDQARRMQDGEVTFHQGLYPTWLPFILHPSTNAVPSFRTPIDNGLSDSKYCPQGSFLPHVRVCNLRQFADKAAGSTILTDVEDPVDRPKACLPGGVDWREAGAGSAVLVIAEAGRARAGG